MQPTHNTCASTCLAMLLDVPAKEVIDEFHSMYFTGEYTVRQYLKEKGVVADRLYTDGDDQALWDGHIYLVTVPSLNIQAGTHYIIIDCRDDDANPIIYDPAKGREGKKYYITRFEQPANEFEVHLSGFVVDHRISVAPALGV